MDIAYQILMSGDADADAVKKLTQGNGFFANSTPKIQGMNGSLANLTSGTEAPATPAGQPASTENGKGKKGRGKGKTKTNNNDAVGTAGGTENTESTGSNAEVVAALKPIDKAKLL
jgi:hypothetical protein